MLEKIKESITNFVENHPEATLAVAYIGGIALALPACVWCARLTGKAEGTAIAKELTEAGVKLGYSHD